MLLVREYINEKFSDESDPIKDFGIGIESIIENFFEKFISEDKKSNFEYGDSTDAKIWSKSETMFRYIEINNGVLLVACYHNLHRDKKTKKIINNVDYVKKILKKINILFCMKKNITHNNPSNDFRQCTEIRFYVKPEYIKFFKQKERLSW